jgi:thiamine biosynthesis protein ThiS
MGTETARIIANGQDRKVKQPYSVADLLQELEWKPTQVVVEYNGRVLPRTDVVTTWLCDGDQLEIILPVAGG